MAQSRHSSLLLALATGSILVQCGKTGSAQPPSRPATGTPVPAATVTARYRTVTVVDAEGIGLEAFRLVAPADWPAEGGVRWVLDNPLQPAVVDFRVRSPQGLEEIQILPNQACFWSNNPTVMSLHPPGSRYFGCEVRKPVTAAEALKAVVLPRFRRDMTGLKVVSGEELPDLAKQVAAASPAFNHPASAAKIRVEYAAGGTAIEEEIYAVVEGFSYPVHTRAGPVTHTNWFVDSIVSFKAEKGRLDGQARAFQAIVRSFKTNPKWFNAYGQIVEALIRQKTQQIKAIGEVGRMAARTNSEISEQRMKDWQARQAVNDRVVDDFCRGIRGVDLYRNPYEDKPVELPSGYGNAWVSRGGEYILTENPTFNPNVGSNVEWTRIEPAR
jgi:hypothetical protein